MNEKGKERFLNKSGAQAEVVCFGMVTPAVVLIVDSLPEHNTGGVTREVCEFISDDAAIIACPFPQ